MTPRTIGVVFSSTVITAQALQGPVASAGSQRGRAADLAAIEKVRQQDIAATLSRDPVALTDLWTDDAIRIGMACRRTSASRLSERATNARRLTSFQGLSYVPETKDVTILDGGWAVEWRQFTASDVDLPGGEAKQIRGTVLAVLKKLPDGNWKVFRAMGGPESGAPGPSRWLVM